MGKVIDRYDSARDDMWKWLVKYGYNHTPTDKGLKKDKMWQEFWNVWRAIDQLSSDIHEAPDDIKEDVARQILLPYKINLDEILERHF